MRRRWLPILGILALAATASAQSQTIQTQHIECDNPNPQTPSTCPDNWGLDLIDEDASTVQPGSVQRDETYHYSATGQGVHVFLVDSGIDTDDPEFAGRIGAHFFSTGDSRGIEDCHGGSHGTRVSSITGGLTYGVAKGVTFHPVKITGKTLANGTHSATCTVPGDYTVFRNALDFVRSQVVAIPRQERRVVVNMSFNIPVSVFTPEQRLELTAKLRELIAEGVVVVASAGNKSKPTLNDDPRNYWPSEVPEVILVGGLDKTASRWFRIEGEDPAYTFLCTQNSDCGSNGGNLIDLWAPAAYIRTALADFQINDETRAPILNSGTSFAAPFVTGVVALYLQDHPGADPATVLQVLRDKAILLGDIDGDGSPDRLVSSVLTDEEEPCVNEDSFSTPANTYFSFLGSELQANDCSPANFLYVDQPQHGTVEISGVGPTDVAYRYVPAPGFTGTDTFSYHVENDQGVRATATVTVTVWSPSTFVANPDHFMTGVDELLAILGSQLTANDSPGAVLIRAEQPVHGTLTLAGIGPGDRVYHYTPPPGFVGEDQFEYLISPTGSEPGTSGVVTVVVNDWPPQASFVANCSDRTCTFDASASSDDGEIASYDWSFGDGSDSSSPAPSHTYASSADFDVTLTITDDRGQTATEVRTVVANLLPVAGFTVNCNGATCTFDASGSSDEVGISSYEWIFGDGFSGSGVTVSHTYANGGNFTAKLTVVDSLGASAETTRLITVPAANRPPVANADSAATDRNVAIDINVLANDSDPDNDPISVSNWTQPAHGTVTKNPNGTMRYTPAAGYTGGDGFTYQISDGSLVSAPPANVSLLVRIPNNPPDARDDGWSTYQNGPTNVPFTHLLANDYDPNGDALTVTGINTAGLTGTLDCSSGTYCRYTPPSWFVGTTSFTYQASDGKGGTDPATVRIKVGGANGSPAPQDDILETAYGTALTFTRDTLLLNDSDPNGDVLSITSIYRAPLTALGTVSCSAAYYVCTYTPPAGFTGVDVLWYRASDGIGFTDARIRILVRPPSPAVLDAREDQTFFTSTGGTFLSYTWMTSNDYDPEGGALTVVGIDTTGLLGSLDCTTFPNGCQYTRGTSDPTRFRYTVRDPQGNLATTTVTLKPGNWAFNLSPVIANDQLSTRTNTPLVFSIFDVLRNDYDPDNDQLAVQFNFGSTSGRVLCSAAAYVCTYTPNANFTGTDTLTYYANDGNNAVSGSVTMTVLPVTARDAQILSQSVPVSMFAGQSYPVSLRIKNVGTQTWSPIGPQCNAFRLGSVNPYDNTTWGASRVELPAAVAPGGEATLNFTVTAPSTPGVYNFQRRMLQECVAWFGDLGPNVVVSVSP